MTEMKSIEKQFSSLLCLSFFYTIKDDEKMILSLRENKFENNVDMEIIRITIFY